ncbi:hypothetical protein GH714_032512 [Hevea brasiliensis]|uniref:Uncharacterized protein n=1 Tax=Hevea brasiliensis TaxID=3981 RepID=A0A6A6NLB0_HEVBR|nr:hypothetical protein GH714_032512 [Hevea brasiliensis]
MSANESWKNAAKNFQGIVIGILICGVHAVLKNADGLFLDEREAASRSLISSASGAGYGAVPPRFGHCCGQASLSGYLYKSYIISRHYQNARLSAATLP